MRITSALFYTPRQDWRITAFIALQPVLAITNLFYTATLPPAYQVYALYLPLVIAYGFLGRAMYLHNILRYNRHRRLRRAQLGTTFWFGVTILCILVVALRRFSTLLV